MKLGKYEICRTGWKLRQALYITILRQNYFFSKKISGFAIKASTDWMMPTYNYPLLKVILVLKDN